MKTFKSHMTEHEMQLALVWEHMHEENINPDDLTEEELNEIIGKVIGGAAKLAAKGIRRGLVNKQGNLRVSRAGRNDARQAKIDAIEKKKKELKRATDTRKKLQTARASLRTARKDFRQARRQTNP